MPTGKRCRKRKADTIEDIGFLESDDSQLLDLRSQQASDVRIRLEHGSDYLHVDRIEAYDTDGNNVLTAAKMKEKEKNP